MTRNSRWLLVCALVAGFAVPVRADDCDDDGIEDSEAIAKGLVPDCNGNGVPDYCDIWVDYSSNDCNNNGIPDDCETDCNANGVPDDCDILYGTSGDCDGNRIPDECDGQTPPGLDCNANDVLDPCDVRATLAFDVETVEFAIDHSGFALNPIDVVIGDMNGDQRPDIVSANRSFPLGRSVGVWLALSDGSFAPGEVYNAGIDCEGVAIGDFDGDQDLDVAVTVRRSPANGIDILLNNGAGVLTHHASLVVGSYLIDIQIADVSGDGLADLVAADINGARVAVLRNLGGAAFAAPIYLPVGTRPIYLSVADFNGDQNLDIAASVQGGGGSVAILRNLGGGTFAPAVHLPVPDFEGGNEIDAVDVDGDGAVDIVLAQQTYKRIAVYRNQGDGTFAAPLLSTGPADNIVAIASGDFDGDDVVDVALSTSSGYFPNGDPRPGYACVMRGVGDGTFLGPLPWLAGDSPLSIAAGDLTGDGRPDMVVGVYQNEVIRVYRNNTAPAASGDVNHNQTPDECECIGDLDQDGAIDLDDLSLLLSHFGMPAAADEGDIDGNGVVDLSDLALLLSRFGLLCS